MFYLKKESLQPQVPLRLPCYDFTPITPLTLEKTPPMTPARRNKKTFFLFNSIKLIEFLM